MLLLSAVILLFVSAISLQAANEDQFERPDVLVLVLGGLGSNDLVSVQYTTVVPLNKAQADLDVMRAVGHWQVKDAKGETKSSGGPKPVMSTSISFATPGIINHANGTLDLEPFITALKRFKYIEVDYLVPSAFQFHGLKDFEDRYVNIKMRPSTNSYRYRVVVKDSSFEKLNLPLRVSEARKPAEHQGMSLAARLALGIGLGLVGAAAVFLIATYLGRRRRSDT